MPPSRRFVYEYHLRDHQQNLRLAFRAETAQRVLRLTMEDDRDEDGSSYPAFRRVNATRDYSLAYQGRASAAVSASQPGPSTRLPVVGGDVVKVDFFYTTPAGAQHQRAAAPLPTGSPAPRSLRLLPVLLPAPGSEGQPGGVDGRSGRAGGVGLQLQLSGLLGGRARSQTAAPGAPATYENAEVTGAPAPQPTMTLPAYLRWELRDAAGDVVQSAVVVVPAAAPGSSWQHLSTSIAVDKGPDGKLNGTLNVQLLNEGSQPVYVDSLTIRHPQPALLVSQENHYYPFGMNLSGVAVNTRPAEMMSKRLYNGGSLLEDDLLDGEGANYSTPYRRYDATIGRFLGVDPLADVYADQGTGVFANADPINFQDPTGAYGIGVDGFHGFSLKGGRGQDSFSNPQSDPLGRGDLGVGMGQGLGAPSSGNPWASTSIFDLHTAYGNEYWMSTVAVKSLNQFVPGLEAFRRDGSFGYYTQSNSTSGESSGGLGGVSLSEIGVGAQFHALEVKPYDGQGYSSEDYVNSIIARASEGNNYAGATIGALEVLVLNGGGNAQQWLGKNGKYYSMKWGGNGATGARRLAVQASKNYKLAGKAFLGAGIAMSAGQALYNGGSNRDIAKFGAATAFAAVGFAIGGPVGLAVGFGLGYMDANGYFNGAYELFDDRKRW